ncbi:unnamed protein product [Heterobilharzia americana]|nr:unnamed protein product [Heterobilharzia americana]
MDTPKAKNLMDQYFQRLRRILSRACDSSGVDSKKHENSAAGGKVCPKATKFNNTLSARVRFMIEDLVDLRENNWVPRRAGQRTETNKPRFLRDIRLEILKESGILVAPTPSERSITQPDVPGSAFMGHSSTSSNSSVNNELPFVSGLNCNSSRNSGEAKSWLELARMGEELCRQSSHDLCFLDNGSRSGDNAVNHFHGRPQSNHVPGTRRFFSNKSDVPNSSNVLRMKTTNDTWATKVEKTEASDTGWVRGVNARLRNSSVTPGNSVSTANTNLPPRMLRKLAAEAAGSSPASSTLNVCNEAKQPAHSEAYNHHTKSNSDNPTSISRNSPSYITPFIHSLGQSHSTDLFEPAYLQKNKSMVTNDENSNTQKLVWATFPKFSSNSMHGTSQSDVSPKSQSLISSLNKPSFPDVQSLAVNKSCNRKTEQVRSSDLSNSVQSSNHASESHCIPHASDESKRIAAKLLDLLCDVRDPVSVKNRLNVSNVGRITIEVLAVVVLHLCEEGTNLKLAEAEPSELAELLVICSENLLCRDGSVSAFNSKDSRKPKSMKSFGHPLALVWSHLLQKILCVTQLIYSKSKIALISAALIWNCHISLSEFAEPLRGGKHHPLFLLVLQKLSQMVNGDFKLNKNEAVCIAGATSDDRRSSLIQLFQETGLQMNQMVPEGSRTNESLLALLEERDLDFLVPSLRLSTKLSHLIMDNSYLEGKNPEDCDKIVASRLNDYLSKHPLAVSITKSDYAHACLPVIYEYIYKVGIVELGVSSSPSTLMTRERAAWKSIVPYLLADTLRNSVDRQLDALHDLQIFWVDKSMPKGFLFRCFMNLYDCELVCEDVFLSWKEEVNPSYPAKGQALFEVNRWLTWLETAEEEDEENQSKSDPNENHEKSVEDCAHLENLTSTCSLNTKSIGHFSEMVCDIIPPTLHSNSAALGS